MADCRFAPNPPYELEQDVTEVPKKSRSPEVINMLDGIFHGVLREPFA
jgi:hypothetical protein